MNVKEIRSKSNEELNKEMTSLKEEALKSYKASVNMNFNAIFETTYPKVFDIIPQEQMKMMFGQMILAIKPSKHVKSKIKPKRQLGQRAKLNYKH